MSMPQLTIDGAAVDRVCTWSGIVAAMEAGHRAARPQVGDVYLNDGADGLFTRSAWITGLGSLVKAACVNPANPDRTPPLPTIQGNVLLFAPGTGEARAIIDGAAVTRWKTAGDSALGSKLLSRPDSRVLLLVGAGVMAEALAEAHVAIRPSIETVVIWNRSPARAEALASRLAHLGRTVQVTSDLPSALGYADIVSAATITTDPIIHGRHLKPGAHVDLIGAYTKTMREADDDTLRRGRLFVDYRGTTIGHIGELVIPMATGVISEKDVLADHYDLVAGAPGRLSPDDITVFKNGGGAHLDLMTALAILNAVTASSQQA